MTEDARSCVADAIAGNSGRTLEMAPKGLREMYFAEADNVIAAIHAAGFHITRVVHKERVPFIIEEES